MTDRPDPSGVLGTGNNPGTNTLRSFRSPMPTSGGKRLNEATSRHSPTPHSTRLRTAWRFKSSHPHSRFKPFRGPLVAQTPPHCVSGDCGVASSGLPNEGQRRRERIMRHKLAAAVCTLLFAGLTASAALAGEVKGPPGGVNSVGGDTAAPAHANSICAFSGLNDFRNGPTVNRTQTPANQGAPGTPGTACRGGSNPDNPPSP